MANQRSKNKKCKTITLPKALAAKIQAEADKTTGGDFSAVVAKFMADKYGVKLPDENK